jgi:hypothetical protein
MKYFIFSGCISDETVKPLLDFIGENEGPLRVSLNSGGGCASLAWFLSAALNENKDRLTLTANCGIYSAAFEIFHRFQGPKELTFGCRGAYHLSRQEITMLSTGEPLSGEAETQLTGTALDAERELNFAADFMTGAEFDKMKRGEDVFFNFKRMREIFPQAKVI